LADLPALAGFGRGPIRRVGAYHEKSGRQHRTTPTRVLTTAIALGKPVKGYFALALWLGFVSDRAGADR